MGSDKPLKTLSLADLTDLSDLFDEKLAGWKKHISGEGPYYTFVLWGSKTGMVGMVGLTNIIKTRVFAAQPFFTGQARSVSPPQGGSVGGCGGL